MEYRLLGSSGLAVSALALGTLTFGQETDEAGSFAQLDRFTEAGGSLIDTADVYVGGRSEEIIGRWLRARPGVRDAVVIATKGRFPAGPGPNGLGLSRQHLSRALDGSLRRLQVDTIDLYQLHGWDPLTRVQETLRFLDDAVRAGKINYVGLSNFTAWQIQKYVDLAEAGGLSSGPVAVQPQYNLLARAIEWEIVPACQEAGLGLLPWSPLASGWLTGKYRRGEAPADGTRLKEQPDEGMKKWNDRGHPEQNLCWPIWLAASLFPITHSPDRQTEACGKVRLIEAEPLPQRFHVHGIVDNGAFGRLALGVSQRLTRGLDHAAAKLAHTFTRSR